MHDKGFTLAELIGTIVVLGLLALISLPIITDIIKDSNEKASAQQMNNLKIAVNQWITSNDTKLETAHKSYFLTFGELKDAGFIKTDVVINPVTETQLMGCFIIDWTENIKQYDYYYSEKCTRIKKPVINFDSDIKNICVGTNFTLTPVTATTDDGTNIILDPPVIKKNNIIVNEVDTSSEAMYELYYTATDTVNNLTVEAVQAINITRDPILCK